MLHKFVLLLYLSCSVLASKNPYCKLKCGNELHLVCHRKSTKCGPAKNCEHYVRRPMTDDLRQSLLDKHNFLRNKVATNMEGRLPTAANMNALNWNFELEFIAQCLANQCKPGYDNCIRTSNYRIVSATSLILGNIALNLRILDQEHSSFLDFNENLKVSQNVAYFQLYPFKLNKREFVSLVLEQVQRWFEEIQNIPRMEIDRFTHPNSETFNHFVQLMWAEVQVMGCALSQFKKPAIDFPFIILVCTYGGQYTGGRLIGQPVYLVGAPCSRCNVGVKCNKNFIGLCGVVNKLSEIKTYKSPFGRLYSANNSSSLVVNNNISSTQTITDETESATDIETTTEISVEEISTESSSSSRTTTVESSSRSTTTVEPSSRSTTTLSPNTTSISTTEIVKDFLHDHVHEIERIYHKGYEHRQPIYRLMDPEFYDYGSPRVRYIKPPYFAYPYEPIHVHNLEEPMKNVQVVQPDSSNLHQPPVINLNQFRHQDHPKLEPVDVAARLASNETENSGDDINLKMDFPDHVVHHHQHHEPVPPTEPPPEEEEYEVVTVQQEYSDYDGRLSFDTQRSNRPTYQIRNKTEANGAKNEPQVLEDVQKQKLKDGAINIIHSVHNYYAPQGKKEEIKLLKKNGLDGYGSDKIQAVKASSDAPRNNIDFIISELAPHIHETLKLKNNISINITKDPSDNNKYNIVIMKPDRNDENPTKFRFQGSNNDNDDAPSSEAPKSTKNLDSYLQNILELLLDYIKQNKPVADDDFLQKTEPQPVKANIHINESSIPGLVYFYNEPPPKVRIFMANASNPVKLPLKPDEGIIKIQENYNPLKKIPLSIESTKRNNNNKEASEKKIIILSSPEELKHINRSLYDKIIIEGDKKTDRKSESKTRDDYHYNRAYHQPGSTSKNTPHLRFEHPYKAQHVLKPIPYPKTNRHQNVNVPFPGRHVILYNTHEDLDLINRTLFNANSKHTGRSKFYFVQDTSVLQPNVKMYTQNLPEIVFRSPDFFRGYDSNTPSFELPEEIVIINQTVYEKMIDYHPDKTDDILVLNRGHEPKYNKYGVLYGELKIKPDLSIQSDEGVLPKAADNSKNNFENIKMFFGASDEKDTKLLNKHCKNNNNKLQLTVGSEHNSKKGEMIKPNYFKIPYRKDNNLLDDYVYEDNSVHEDNNNNNVAQDYLNDGQKNGMTISDYITFRTESSNKKVRSSHYDSSKGKFSNKSSNNYSRTSNKKEEYVMLGHLDSLARNTEDVDNFLEYDYLFFGPYFDNRDSLGIRRTLKSYDENVVCEDVKNDYQYDLYSDKEECSDGGDNVEKVENMEVARRDLKTGAHWESLGSMSERKNISRPPEAWRVVVHHHNRTTDKNKPPKVHYHNRVYNVTTTTAGPNEKMMKYKGRGRKSLKPRTSEETEEETTTLEETEVETATPEDTEEETPLEPTIEKVSPKQPATPMKKQKPRVTTPQKQIRTPKPAATSRKPSLPPPTRTTTTRKYVAKATRKAVTSWQRVYSTDDDENVHEKNTDKQIHIADNVFIIQFIEPLSSLPAEANNATYVPIVPVNRTTKSPLDLLVVLGTTATNSSDRRNMNLPGSTSGSPNIDDVQNRTFISKPRWIFVPPEVKVSTTEDIMDYDYTEPIDMWLEQFRLTPGKTTDKKKNLPDSVRATKKPNNVWKWFLDQPDIEAEFFSLLLNRLITTKAHPKESTTKRQKVELRKQLPKIEKVDQNPHIHSKDCHHEIRFPWEQKKKPAKIRRERKSLETPIENRNDIISNNNMISKSNNNLPHQNFILICTALYILIPSNLE